MRRVFELISQVASARSTILVTGESGTGKELVAQAIHAVSPRATERFVSVNCAAIPEELIESELFGHEKGSFTGATEKQIGKFELAHKGTIFLDEVGDMSPRTQAKVLRVLQEGEVERIGSQKTITVDVRIIAATNKKLEELVERGEFRKDLYFRLNVIQIGLPPLRERMEDLSALVGHFIEKYARQNGKAVTGVTPEALEVLAAFNWPGNVRELENVIERGVVLAGGTDLGIDEIPDQVRTPRRPPSPVVSSPSSHPVENIVTHLPAFASLAGHAQRAAVSLAVHLAEEVRLESAVGSLLFMPARGKRGGAGSLSAHETWPGFRPLAYALAGVVLWDLRANKAVEDPTPTDLERYTTGFTRGKRTPLLDQVRSLVLFPPASTIASRAVDITR
jgi:transcriptional regulator with GAF, ATPase, and Fis domain